jgi:spermidine/putrescine-binding protein
MLAASGRALRPLSKREAIMKRTILSAAAVGILGLAASLPVSAAEPPVLRVVTVQTTDVPAYVREIEALKALYKKQGVAVTVDAYQATYAGPNAGTVVVAVQVANLAALAKMNELTRTQPDLVAEMKKVSALRKVVSDSLYEKLTK